MINKPNKDESGNYLFSCNVTIGEQVKLKMDNETIDNVYIRAIIFTNCKVRFSIWFEKSKTTFHNIDSVWVQKIDNPKYIDFDDDNYS